MNMRLKTHLFFFIIFCLALGLSCGSEEEPITISVQDLELTMDENPTAGRVIGTLVATTNRGSVNFRIASLMPAGIHTAIDATSGELTVLLPATFDFETNPVFEIEIDVTNENIIEIATVTIRLNDIADHANMPDARVEMNENPNNNEAVTSLMASVDSGTPTFTIKSQNPMGAFSIVFGDQLIVADSSLFDYEINPTLTVVVTASNAGFSDDGTITVDLQNIPEVLTTQDETVSMDENPNNGQLVTTVTGNTDFGSISYSLLSENVSGAFAIDLTTGALTVADATKFDFETNPGLTVEVGLSNASLKATSKITVNLNDVVEVNWTEANSNVAFGELYGHEIVNLNGVLHCIGGISGTTRVNNVWSSVNGTTWTQVNTGNNIFSPRNGFQAVVFNNKIWVIGGFTDGGRSDEIWSSADGATWTKANTTGIFTPRADHAAVVFNNKIWVVGGSDGAFKNEVWSSTDGSTWVQETTIGNIFSARSGHTLTVFNGSMVLIGGADLDSQQLLRQRNDIWSSTDGINWTEISVTGTLFSERWIHGATVHDNLLWVIGGDDQTGFRFNDVWTSADGGMTWTQQSSTPIFEVRDQMALFVFNNKLWVSGGSNNDGILNDIWVTN
ncbi:MAG: hypothetical protein Roseis2KO_27430 [Roseivirga sp.]